MKRRKMRSTMVVLLTLSLIFQQITFASYAASPIVDVKVNTLKDVEVFLSVGNVSETFQSFKEDLEANLVGRGLPANRLNITAYEEAEIVADGNAWWMYDHYNTATNGIAQDSSNGSYFDSSVINATLTDYPDPKIDDANHQYVELDTRTNNFTLKRHIDTNVPGVITFRGYNSDPNKDFMYYPDDQPFKKKIEFEVNELFAADALKGAAFMFNTQMSVANYGAQTMSGYMIYFPYTGRQAVGQMKLYKFTDVLTSSFHSNAFSQINYTPSGFELIDTAATAYNSLNVSAGKQPWRKVKLEVDATSFKMWYAEDEDNQITRELSDSDLVTWSLSATELSLTAHTGDDLGYGFGPLVEYGSHGCSRPTVFSFLNIGMSAESARGFLDVIRQPNWNENTDRYVVNIDDQEEGDFDSSSKLGEILTRMDNQEIHYIGWGNNVTDEQGNDFIELNSDRGTFINRNSEAYADWIDDTADYIYQRYVTTKNGGSDTTGLGDTVYIPYGTTPDIVVSPSSLMTNTADASYLDGKWKILHDETVYENDMGKNDLHNQYTQNLVDISFDKVGKYDLYYETTKVKTIYVHRKPIARFSYSVDGSLNLTIDDRAYDLDKDEDPSDGTHKGIVEKELSYRVTTNAALTIITTNDGPIVTTDAALTVASNGEINLVPNNDYILRLRVKDAEGEWSTAYSKYLHTGTDSLKPIAEFTVYPTEFYPYKDTLQVEDESYDAAGKAIVSQAWQVIKGKEVVSTGTSFNVSMLNSGIGEYKIYQKVTNADSLESEWFVNYVRLHKTPTPDITATPDVSGGSLEFDCELSGLPSGHGIIYQYKLGSSGTWTSGSDFTVTSTTDVYYRVKDSTGAYSDEGMKAIVIEDYIHTERTPDTDYSNADYQVEVAIDNAYDTAVYKTMYRTISDSGISSWSDYSFGTPVDISGEGTTIVEAKVVKKTDESFMVDWDSSTVNLRKSAQAEVTISYTPNSLYSSTDYDVTLTVSDARNGSSEKDHATVTYAIDSGSFQSYTVPFGLTGEGTYLVTAKAVDRYGNADTDTVTLTIDTTVPTDPSIAFEDAYVAGTWTDENVEFEISGSTDTNGVTYYYSTDDGSTWIQSATGTISLEGVTTIKYKAVDPAGLDSSIKSAVVKIDKTVPTDPSIEFDNGYVAGTWTNETVEFELTGSTDVNAVTYMYSINDGLTWVESTTGTLSDEGITIIKYKTIDGTGLESSVQTAIVKIDKTDPTEPSIDFEDSYVENTWTDQTVEFEIKGSTDLNGVSYLYSINNGSTWTQSATGTISVEGITTIKYKAVDGSGLESSVKVAVVKIDKTRPTKPSIEYENGYVGGTWTDKDVEFEITSSIDANELTYLYTTDEGVTWVESATGTISQEGITIIRYKSIDVAGTVSIEKMATIKIDKTLPTDPSIEFENGYVVGTWSDETVEFELSDSTDSNGVTYFYSVDDGSTWTESTTGSISEEGITIIKYKAVDGTGLESTVKTAIVKIDRAAPTDPIIEFEDDYKVGTWTDQMVNFEIKGSTDASAVTYFYSTNGGLTWTESSTGSIATEGVTTIKYKAIDQADVESKVMSAIVKIDKTLPAEPTIEFENGYVGGTWSYEPVVFEIKGSADTNGVTYFYSVDDGTTWVESTTGTITEEGITTIQYKVVDGTGLESAIKTVDVKIDTSNDETSIGQEYGMILRLLGDKVVEVEQGDLYYEPGYKATDVDGSDISDEVVLSGKVDTNEIGSYIITYTVTGERTVATSRTVKVIEKVLPGDAVITTTKEKVDEEEIEEAIEAAKEDESSSVKIIVPKDVKVGSDVKVSIKKEDVEEGKDNELTLIVESNNVKLELPMKDIPIEDMPKNSSLRILYENMDTQDSDNEEMLEEVLVIDPNIGVYNGMIFDVSMVIVEEDTEGNELGSEKIDHFETEEEIVIELYIGQGLDAMAFLTFYYNEEDKVWEFIRSDYGVDGNIKLMTNHLSIYSVMEMTSAEKRDRLAQLMHAPMTLEEIRNILEDADIRETPDGLSVEILEVYDGLEDADKDKVAQRLLDAGDETPFEDFEDLEEAFTAAVNGVVEEIEGDLVAPVLTLLGDNPMMVYLADAYEEPGARAMDNINGDISGSIIVYGSVDTSVQGSYELRYVVKDSNGNTSEAIRTVEIISAGVKSERDAESEIDLRIEEEVIQLDPITTPVEIRKNNVTRKPISETYKVELGDDEGTITIKYDPDKVTNTDHLGVWMYDESSSSWKYIGGEVNEASNEVVLKITTSGKIALMETTFMYIDVSDHWSEEAANFFGSRGLLPYPADGKFLPEKGITRAEFSAAMTEFLGLEMVVESHEFVDIEEGIWYEAYISAAKHAGIIKGISETEFDPDRVINRQEIAAIIIRALDGMDDFEGVNSPNQEYADNMIIGNWSKGYVYKAKEKNLMIGTGDNYYMPLKETTRGEVAQIIYNIFKNFEYAKYYKK